jgi:DNA-binding response OmpR family regulator
MDCTRPLIVVIEDHDTTRSFLADNLIADGYEVLVAATAADGVGLISKHYPDLVLLDLELPDADGLELLRTIRASDRVAAPIDPDLLLIVLSGRAGELQRLRGFERGCDDYVTKPFSYRELLLRIRALLRRSERRAASIGRLRVGSLEVDVTGRRVLVDGVELRVSNKEYSLLRLLAADPTRVFTREELLKHIWGYQALGHTRTVDSHICRLRAKLAAGGGHRFLVNVWGVGYRLVDGELQ